MDDGDLRREQLTMRAAEQQKVADKKEENKKRKEEAQKAEPKARGRPRKKALAGTVSEGSALPAESSQQPVKRRRLRSNGHQDGAASSAPVAEPSSTTSSAVPAPKAGAKARPKPKAASRSQQHRQQEEVPVNEADKLEMQALLMRFRNVRYNKETETLHKGKFEGVQISVYWTRSAVGVKIWDAPSAKWKQVQYFSEEPLCLRIFQASKFAAELSHHLPTNRDWAETADGIRFGRILRQSAAAALIADRC